MADTNSLSKSVPQLAPSYHPGISRSPSPNTSSLKAKTTNTSNTSDDHTLHSLAKHPTKETLNDASSAIVDISNNQSQQINNIHKQEWLNKFSSSSSSALASFSNSSGAYANPNQQPWRLTRAVIRDGSLKLYKPPSDMGIKAFDLEAPLQPPQPSLPTNTHTNSATLAPPNALNNKRSLLSTSSLMPAIPAKGISGSRLFFKGLEPHPDLKYNEKGKIIGGTDEAICHAILFGPSEEFAKTSVLLLPLLTDMVDAIELLALYSTSVSHTGTNASTIPFSSANHNLSSVPAASTSSNPNATLGTLLVSRLELVVKTIQDNFPGMLLDNDIFSVFMRLVESVSYHDDAVATDLKMSVFMKQKTMTDMLSYATHQDPIMWSGIQPNLNETTSDKLHYILSKLEINSNNMNSSNHQSYTNVNSTTPLNSIQLPSAIPPNLILDISWDTFAKQIYHFHLAFSKDWPPTSDIALLFNTKYNYHRHSPLVFDSINIHFLGTLLIDHLFNPTHRIDNAYRGKIITYWINLGNSLKNSGDMVGWLSIATVICSISVLRLRGTWCYVANDIRDRVIKEWAPVVFDLERRLMISDMSRKSTYHVLAPQGIGLTYPKERVVPFFGDLCVKFQEGSTYKQCESRLNSIKTAFQRWGHYLDQIPQNDTFESLPEAIPVIQKLLYALLSRHFEAPVVYPEAILKMSLEVEPSVSGQYLKHHYNQRSLLATGSYLPLVFNSTIPTYSLFSRSGLIAISATTSSSPKRTLRASSSRSGDAFRNNASNSTGSKNFGSASSASSNAQRSLASPESFSTITGYTELDGPSRAFIGRHAGNNLLLRNIRDLLNINTTQYQIFDDIVLKSFDDEELFKLENDKRDSTSRQASNQVSDAANSGESNSPKHVNVVVKAATLERLIDILVLGVNDFNTFVEGNTRGPLHIDMDAHTLTFFATFRSFCSPAILLDNLRKRFVGAQSAAVSISQKGNLDREPDLSSFPNWDPNCDIDPAFIDWRLVAQIQIGILEACYLWVSQFFSDFANDLAIRDQFLDLLKTFELELQTWKESGALGREEYNIYYETIEALHRKVRKLFIKKSYRPVDIKRLVPTFPVGTKIENLPANGGIQQLEQLINDVDCVAAEYFNMIQLKDWIEIFEYLEVQGSELSGFFHYRTGHLSNDDDIVIQDIFTHFETLYRETPENRLLFSFPRPVRELFRLHNNIVNYFTTQISDNTIKKDERVERMASILKILGIIKQRMKNMSLFDGEPKEDSQTGFTSYIPSFLESAIAAAIVRPESRGFANTWIQASKEIFKQFGGSFSGSLNNLESIIPEIPVSLLKKSNVNKALTPCIGWLLERVLEVICYVPNMSSETPNLINFDKRRYAYNLFTSISEMKGSIQGLDTLYDNGMNVTAVYNFAKQISYIINPVKGLYHFDRRVARDTAYRELKEFSKSLSKVRIFVQLVQAENEKLKRDSRQKEAVERTAKEVKKASRNKSTVSVSSGGSSSASERKSGLARFGGFFKSVRPISMALTGNFAPSAEKIVNPEDLPDLEALGDARFKLSSTVDLANITVSPFRTNRDHQHSMFKISGDGIQDIVFQAVSDTAAEEWISSLSLAQKQAALMAVMSPTSTKVFGVPVRIVCEREGNPIPYVVETLLDEIEARGLDEVGLYRIPGSLASVNALKSAFDSGGVVNMEDPKWYDINAATGCFKSYLRELPEPLLTAELFSDFVICGTMGNTPDGIAMLRRCVHRLPAPNYNLLKRLVDHLVLVTKHGVKNLMHAVNLAIVFSMSFLPNSSSTQSVSNDLGAMQTMLKTMINAHDQIFMELPEEDVDGPLPSQLPPLSTDHFFGLDEGRLPPPQLNIESESEGSVKSLDAITRNLSHDEEFDRENLTVPLNLPSHSSLEEDMTSHSFGTMSISSTSGIQDTTSSNLDNESNMLSIPTPVSRRTDARMANKRFSSLLLPSDIAEAGIPPEPVEEEEEENDEDFAKAAEAAATTDKKRSNRDSFTEVSAY